jgi:hypothetical protein
MKERRGENEQTKSGNQKRNANDRVTFDTSEQ